MRTFCPFFRFALSINACRAVKPTKGIEAASSILSFFGLHGDGIFIDRDQFSEAANSILRWPCIDLVANLESPHSRSHLNHDSRHIITQDERQAIRQNQFELAASYFGVQWVDTCGVDLDQHVVLPQLWLGHFANPPLTFLSMAIDDKCLHIFPYPLRAAHAGSLNCLRRMLLKIPSGTILRMNVELTGGGSSGVTKPRLGSLRRFEHHLGHHLRLVAFFHLLP